MVIFNSGFVDKYNDTIHTSTNTKPSETFTKLEYEKEINVRKPKFKVVDIVRTILETAMVHERYLMMQVVSEVKDETM